MEPRSHQKSKHVPRRYHLIREIIGRNDVKIEKVPTDDPLTKPLPQNKYDSHVLAYDIRYKGDRLSCKWGIFKGTSLNAITFSTYYKIYID